MKITYLGTAAAEAIPALFCQCPVCENARKHLGKEYRCRSACCIDGDLLIDFPPDIYCSSIRAGVYLPGIRNIIFTHSHEDHCAPDELANRVTPVYCKRRPGEDYETGIYAGEGTLLRLKKLEGRPGLKLHYLPLFTPTVIGDKTVTALRAYHMQNEECYLYLVEKDGGRFLYGHDTGDFPADTMEYLKGKMLDAASLDCTNVMLNWKGGGHMGILGDADIRRRLIEQGSADAHTKFIAHHFSHNGFIPDGRQYSLAEFEEICAGYGFEVSYDGMKFEI